MSSVSITVVDNPTRPLSVVEEVALILDAMEDWSAVIEVLLLHIVTIKLCCGTAGNPQCVVAFDASRDGLVCCKDPLHEFLHHDKAGRLVFREELVPNLEPRSFALSPSLLKFMLNQSIDSISFSPRQTRKLVPPAFNERPQEIPMSTRLLRKSPRSATGHHHWHLLRPTIGRWNHRSTRRLLWP